MPNRCNFQTWYYNYNTWLEIPYRCDEEALSTGINCVFHDLGYWQEKPNEVTERLIKKIEIAISEKEDLLCIGYNLPEIRLTQDFEKAAYFDFTRFHDLTDFKGTTFDLVSFEGAQFDGTPYITFSFLAILKFSFYRIHKEHHTQKTACACYQSHSSLLL